MHLTKRLLTLSLTAAVLCPACPSGATTDSAQVHSVYFRRASDFTGDTGNNYAARWRTWLQYHRAIERVPQLRRHLLQLPEDYDQGRKGALPLIHSRLPAQIVRSQPTGVYVLQLGVYRTPGSVASFLRQHWPKVAKRSIYEATSKEFRLGFSSESESKSEPLFLLAGKVGDRPAMRLCYGIYASTQDARRDAAQFRRWLGYEPVVVPQPLTAQLARAFIFTPVAGRIL